MLKHLKLKHLFKIKNFKFQIIFLFTICFLLPSTRIAKAQSLSLSIWPPLLEVMAQPGKKVTQVYKITNNSDHDLSITPQIYPFEPTGNFGQIKIRFNQPAPLVSSLNPLPSFFSFDSGETLGKPFPLAVGQTKELVLKISVPLGAEEKDYYYTLLFSSQEEIPLADSPSDRSQTGSTTQIGSNILLTVSILGKPVLLGKIVNFSAPRIIDSFSPVNFQVVLENWGKTLWKPFGRIIVTGPFKQEKELRILEQNVLSNSTRQLDLTPLYPKIPFGPFKAKLDFTLNEDGPKLFTEINFWFIPYKLLGVLIVVILGIFLTKKMIKTIKNAKKQTQQSS